MARKGLIRWRPQDKAKLATKVRVFNAKRTRLIKQVPELAEILPPKVNIREWEAAIKTRRDFNYAISRLENFMKKDATKIVVVPDNTWTGTEKRITKWERDDSMRAMRRYNKRREKMRLEAGFTSEYEEGAQDLLGTTAPTKGVKDWFSWGAFRRRINQKVWESYDMGRAQLYQSNYMKSLQTVYGDSMPQEMMFIRDLISKLTPEEMVLAMNEDDILDIHYQYINGEDDAVFTLIPIISHWMAWMDKKGIEYDIKGREYLLDD